MVPLKYSIFLLVCPLLVFAKMEIPDDLRELLNQMHIDCLKEGGLTEDDWKAFNIKNRTPELMCYIKCLFHTAQWVNDDEILQYDFIKENAHEIVKPLVLPIIEECGKNAKGGKCEKTFSIFECMNKANPEDFVIM